MNTSWKEPILGVLTVIAGAANAIAWRQSLTSGTFANASLYSLPLITLFSFTILFAITAAFTENRLLRNAIAIAALASSYVAIPFQPVVLGGFVLSAVGGWYASNSIATEHAVEARFSVRKIFRSGLPIFFTSLALALSVGYYSTIETHPSEFSFVPRTLFDITLPLIEKPMQSILPGFKSKSSVNDLILSLVQRQAGQEVDFSRFTPEERDQIVAEGRKSFNQQLGTELKGDENAGQALYDITNAQVRKFAGSYQSYLPILAAVGFFAAVKALTLPLYWLSLILIYVVVKLLLYFKFLRRATEMQPVEKITL